MDELVKLHINFLNSKIQECETKIKMINASIVVFQTQIENIETQITSANKEILCFEQLMSNLKNTIEQLKSGKQTIPNGTMGIN